MIGRNVLQKPIRKAIGADFERETIGIGFTVDSNKSPAFDVKWQSCGELWEGSSLAVIADRQVAMSVGIDVVRE